MPRMPRELRALIQSQNRAARAATAERRKQVIRRSSNRDIVVEAVAEDKSVNESLKTGIFKNDEQVWFKNETISETFYTINSSYKTMKVLIGSGEKKPTPKELFEFFTDPEHNVLDQKGNLMSEHNYDSNYQETFGLGEVYLEELAKAPVELPAGAYQYVRDNSGEKLYPMEIREDSHVPLYDALGYISSSFNNFIEKEHIYREREMLYKLGVLLYGPPGNGKTSLIRELLRKSTLNNSVIIFFQALPSLALVKKINSSLRNRFKIFVLEELTEVLNNTSMDYVLNFLDGELSMDKSIVFATTNYPEKLPGNLVDRPSRFDKLVFCDHPKDKDRKKLLTFFLGREVTDAEVADAEGLSIAAIKEICLMVLVEDSKFSDAVDSLKRRSAICKKMFKESKDSWGF